jgi:two-component system, NarL family, response regulator NreC
MTIAVADDHPLVRQGLRAVLSAEPDFQVVGEAENGLEAAELVERLKPDALVVDMMMPGLNGLEVTRQVSHRCPHTRVIILSMHADESYVLEALRNGAAGYVLKDSSAAELLQAVRDVVDGRRYLCRQLSERAIEAYVEKAEGAVLDIYESLTTREREVLQLAAEGCSSTDIASRLSISPRTAETHRTNLMRKLGLHSQTDLIRYAIRRRVIPLES